MHGLDPAAFPEMNGIFYAVGPNIRAGRTVGAFESIHVYPLVARILGLPLGAAVDGSAAVLNGIYVDRRDGH
jgi:alkaline phosphatase D